MNTGGSRHFSKEAAKSFDKVLQELAVLSNLLTKSGATPTLTSYSVREYVWCISVTLFYGNEFEYKIINLLVF